MNRGRLLWNTEVKALLEPVGIVGDNVRSFRLLLLVGLESGEV